MIKKDIKYVWIDNKSTDGLAHIPRVYQICIMSGLVFNPDYTISIYTNKPLAWEDLKTNNPNVRNIIISDEYNARMDNCGIGSVFLTHKSDYLRYSLLHDDGGIYCDTDIFIIKSFDDLLDRKVVMAKEKNTALCCAVQLAEDNHPLYTKMLYSYHNDYHPDDYTYNCQKVLLKTINEAYKSEVDILDYEKGFFYPFSREFSMCQFYDDFEIKSKEDISKKFDCYSHHIWASTQYGNILRDYISNNLISIREAKTLRYIDQLTAFIYREYDKLNK